MIRVGAVAVTLGVVWAMSAAALSGQAPAKNTWDGVYTEEQALRGGEAYMLECSSCHQADLAGDGFAPGLSGGPFASAWNGLSLGDLLERVRISMPPTDPGAVPLATKADILAFMLKANRFPAGETELPKDVASLKEIEYKATKP